MSSIWRPNHWGLSTRIVALSLLLLLFIQGAVFSVVRIGIEQAARRQVAQELVVGERVWRRMLDQNAQRLALGASVLAADFGFRAAVNTGDLDTIRSALQNNGGRIGANVTALLDTQMTLRAVGEGEDAAQIESALPGLVQAMARDPQTSPVALVAREPHQFVMVPMKAPVLVGYVLMGFPVSQRLVDDMRALSDMHVAVVVQAPGQPIRVTASTMTPDGLQALQRNAPDSPELSFGDERLVTRSIKLGGSADSGARTLLLRSVDEVVAPFRQAQIALAWITGLGVLLFGVGSVFVSRHVTTPLRALVGATLRLGRGQYDVPMEHTERHDEIGGLAQAFDAMRVNIGNQQAEIRRLAYWDRLTGLPNRSRFREAVQRAIDSQSAVSEMGKGSCAVILLDINRFKHVNDVLGYAFGDRLLVAVARRLTESSLRDHDMVARLGGDEFAVLLTQGDPDTAVAVAQRIASSLEEPLAFDEQTVDLSASMGIACWPMHAPDADTLLSRAEVAMYAAKSRTELTQVYDPSLDSTSAQTLSLLTELRRAIDEGELRLFLQPKLELASGEVVAAEALVRWQHPRRGLVPPLQFIPFAEQTGFVRRLTLWILEECAAHWRGLQQPDQSPVHIAVNLSTRDLLDLDFPARLDNILAKHGCEPAAFCLEITESAIMDDPQRAEATLRRLSDRGYRLSIDDFGTGYSSLAYLKRLPVDELKIDKSFVMSMQEDQDDAKIVRSTVDLAHNLGLTVVAEGVENALIWDKLRELGCDLAQGFHMSKPMPAEEFSDWCRRWRERQTLSGTTLAPRL